MGVVLIDRFIQYNESEACDKLDGKKGIVPIPLAICQSEVRPLPTPPESGCYCGLTYTRNEDEPSMT